MPAANAETMSLHLTAIGRKVAEGSHAALVLDGAGYHIAAALTIPENVTLVRLPPYAPELNPIENVWEYLRGNKLAITVFDEDDDIVDKTCDAWNFFEQDPTRIASITTRTWATVMGLASIPSVAATLSLVRVCGDDQGASTSPRPRTHAAFFPHKWTMQRRIDRALPFHISHPSHAS